MRVLITAGGTRAPIDEVRWVGNVSTGRFGAQLSHHCLARGADVIHLHARGAEMPFQHTIDFEGDWKVQVERAKEAGIKFEAVRSRYRSVVFTELSEYASLLEQLLKEEAIDIVFLAAAVSDYAPEPLPGKLGSKTGEILIRMKPVPKLIAKVKDWAPGVYLVGFKLLAGSTPETLVSTAFESCRHHRADLTVANDLRPLRAGNHTIHLVRDGHPVETYDTHDDPAARLVERVFEWRKEAAPPK